MYQQFFDGTMNDSLRAYFCSELANYGVARSYTKKQLLAPLSAETAFAIVISGQVAISVLSSDGQEKLLYTMYSGGIFGEENLFTDGFINYQATIKEKAKISYISKETLQKIVDANPKVYQYIMAVMTRKNRILVLQLTSITFNDYVGRVADTIIRLVNSADHTNCENKIQISSVAFNQTELASLVGCSRKTINQVLKRLMEENLIAFKGKNIIIKDMPKLEQYVVPIL
jgi:CRP/FNR family cyclic AMP-dependent transcriptional regulator